MGDRVTCEMCERYPQGGYDFGCDRCVARAFVRAPQHEQTYTQRLWKESMDPERYEAMRKYVAEERERQGMVSA